MCWFCINSKRERKRFFSKNEKKAEHGIQNADAKAIKNFFSLFLLKINCKDPLQLARCCLYDTTPHILFFYLKKYFNLFFESWKMCAWTHTRHLESVSRMIWFWAAITTIVIHFMSFIEFKSLQHEICNTFVLESHIALQYFHMEYFVTKSQHLY